MWVRGLKLVLLLRLLVVKNVAPHVGAWIETAYIWEGGNPPVVAPHVGAWIETSL